MLVLVLNLLSNPSCRREVGASWTDVAVTLVAGIGGPAAEVAGLVARPFGGDGTCGGTAGLWLRLAPARAFESSVGPGCRRCQCPCGYGYVIIHTYIHVGSVVRWLFGCGLVGFLVVLIMPFFVVLGNVRPLLLSPFNSHICTHDNCTVAHAYASVMTSVQEDPTLRRPCELHAQLCEEGLQAVYPLAWNHHTCAGRMCLASDLHSHSQLFKQLLTFQHQNHKRKTDVASLG